MIMPVLFCRRPQRNKEKILIVDAGNDDRKLLTGILTAMGYEPVGAAGWIEALKLFTPGNFDLVFTDSKIICWDGFCLAFHIKARSSQIPVVMMVARSEKNAPDNREGCCFDDLLFKPFEPIDIQSVLQQIFKSRLKEEDIAFYCDSKAI